MTLYLLRDPIYRLFILLTEYFSCRCGSTKSSRPWLFAMLPSARQDRGPCHVPQTLGERLHIQLNTGSRAQDFQAMPC
jgi:hypothetical protein